MYRSQQTLLAAVLDMLPMIQEDAARSDAAASFPKMSFDHLREAGLLKATLPVSLGGLGFGSGAKGALALVNLLTLLAEGSLPVARLYEAHVNALQLICRYGTSQLVARCALDATAGELFALWVTDPPKGGLKLIHSAGKLVLDGQKNFCSAAGVATRALVTAEDTSGSRMLIVNPDPGAVVKRGELKLNGMCAAVTGSVDLSGMIVSPDTLLGTTGDYLREPVFSSGAWRGSAGALGGLMALVKLHRQEILQRKRAEDPHQMARFGQLMQALETAKLWVTQAALRSCLEDQSTEAVVAYVNLARLAVESACMDAIRLVQRGLGLSGFLMGRPVERICRDLATYLRQPAPDETLVRAAHHYFYHDIQGCS